MDKVEKVMGLGIALFNSHINNAAEKAKSAFIKRFGGKAWDIEIQPFIDKGVMSVFNNDPNDFTKWYVEAVGIFVNENRE